VKALAWLWRCGAWLVLGLFVFILLGESVVGQAWHGFAFLMHLPPQPGIVVLMGFALPGWWWGKRLGMSLLGLALVIAGPFLGYRLGGKAVSEVPQGLRGSLRLVTVNRGQSHGHPIGDFLDRVNPDVVLVQDAHSVGALNPNGAELAMFPFKGRLGTLAVVSRLPMGPVELIPLVVRPGDPAMGHWHRLMRVEVKWEGERVCLYTLHLPSPRTALEFYRSGGVFRPGGSFTAQQMWNHHSQMVERVMLTVEADIRQHGQRSVILGDWNLPPIGPLYRRVTRQFLDTHAAEGEGWGFTCPGDMPLWFAGMGPWLRIDHILCTRDWQIIAHEVEAPSGAQHCAVAAVLKRP
jgi:hypothetical protein